MSRSAYLRDGRESRGQSRVEPGYGLFRDSHAVRFAQVLVQIQPLTPHLTDLPTLRFVSRTSVAHRPAAVSSVPRSGQRQRLPIGGAHRDLRQSGRGGGACVIVWIGVVVSVVLPCGGCGDGDEE
ncbi:uncharacterized protein M421DRAFT_425908 [Didymella exigua CBS 183.55]|uniref:Uncharacterized protein n=1 Tax=Didymella exigua CBS 183.55 TaxID=1150837 RepID=A0A6A5R834_9PLEO|nr:uncharacterized protein M421DRAFT_425908 [Didymella exigua CBS 183.55]KAF1923380.1 hypothetical protein M421DRAFT_425908 [Didymella exigua CBS 183.55]